VGVPIYKKINKDFFKKWTPEMAYVLGFFAADGYMVKNKRGAHFIDFYSTDRCILEKILKIVDGNQKISIRKRVLTQRPSYRLQFGSKVWFEDLTKLGFMQCKSKVLQFPTIPMRYLKDFVRGYFDGDGSVNLGRYFRKDRKKWHWVLTTQFTSGSRPFLKELWYHLHPYILGGHIHEKTPRANGSGHGYDLIFSIHDSIRLADFMYKNSDHLYLPRKLKVFQKASRMFGLRA